MAGQVTIREAALDDVPRLLEMSRHFIEASAYNGVLEFDDARIEALVRLLIERLGVALVAEVPGYDGPVGMIGLAIVAHPYASDRVCEELAWWVEPSRRRDKIGPALLEAAENWARGKECSMIQMVAPHGSDAVGRYYARRGYAPVETAWMKGLRDDGTRGDVQEDGRRAGRES
jgi:GNAT superfamily N-acetyltransferase